ncbi:MAG: rod-binding protein [Pseudooceanicola sp.]
MPSQITPITSATVAPPPDARLRQVAQALEATFMSEMLKSAGLGEMKSAFGGGTGEAQFASFLRDEQARAMVQAGGIGLAESIYQSLKETRNDDT